MAGGRAENAATVASTHFISSAVKGGTGMRRRPTFRPVKLLPALATGLNGSDHRRR